jgi:GT2 family glycosyltransferase
VRGAATRVVTAATSDQQARADSLARFRHMRERWTQTDVAISPSLHLRDRFVAAGFPAATIRVSPLGIEPPRHFTTRSPSSAPLRLAYLGSLMASKAPHVLLEALPLLPPGSVTVDLFGDVVPYHGDDSYADRLAPLLSPDAVRMHGTISHDRVPDTLSRVDALVVPSIWEENCPLVIREAFAMGVPVIASRIGGIPETVVDGAGGLLFTPGDSSDLARVLRGLIAQPGQLDRLRAKIPPVRTLDDDLSAVRALYEELTRSGDKKATNIGSATTSLAAVVLNYRTPDETRLAVGSIAASEIPFDDIVVVDNGSNSGCRAALSQTQTPIAFLETGTNLGFSGGVNVGIREALARGASHVLLVNSDVILPPDTTALLVDAMARHPRAGIVAPVLLCRRRPDRIASAGMTYSERSGRMRHLWFDAPYSTTTLPDWIEVAGVSGCAMLIARPVFERIGLFDEAFFFSFEDLAFSLAARDAGFDVGVCGRAVAYHEGSRSLGATSPRRLYFATRNHLRLAAMRPGQGRLHRLARAAMIVGLNGAYAAGASGGSIATRLLAVARGVRDHAAGRYGTDDVNGT